MIPAKLFREILLSFPISVLYLGKTDDFRDKKEATSTLNGETPRSIKESSESFKRQI